MSGYLAYVIPVGAGHPDNSLPGGPPLFPSHGLPGQQPGIDNSLPGGGFGGRRPVDPGYGVIPWVPPGGSIEQPIFLPPGIWPVPPGTPGGGTPTHPIYIPPSGGTAPDQGLPGSQPGVDNTLPGQPAAPDQGLPPSSGGQPDQGLPPSGSGGSPDQGLPEGGGGGSAGQLPTSTSFILIYSAPRGGWVLITPAGASGGSSGTKPDQGLPSGGSGAKPDQGLPPHAQPKKK